MMNKSILLSLIGLTSTGSGLGITAIFGGFNGDSALITLLKDYPALVNYDQLTSDVLNALPNISLETASDIAKYYSKLPCSRYLFRGPKWKGSDNSNAGSRLDLSSAPKEKKTKRDPNSQVLKLKGDNVMGCLNVWWEKEVYENKKWKGTWNLVWSVSDGEHGILLSSTAKTENGKIKVDGQGYTLKKEGNKWETKASSFTSAKEVTEQNKDQLVIKSGPSVEKEPGRFWGFNFDISNVCESNENCNTGKVTKLYSKRSWNLMSGEAMPGESEAKELKEWSTNFGAWSKESNENALFPTQNMNMYTKIKGYFKLIASRP